MREIDLTPQDQEVVIKLTNHPNTVYVMENFDEAFEWLKICRITGTEVESISHEMVRYEHELRLKEYQTDNIKDILGFIKFA